MKVNIQLNFLNIFYAQKQKSFDIYEPLLTENEKPELQDVHTEIFLLFFFFNVLLTVHYSNDQFTYVAFSAEST
jgi:hypothetical protein